ncbi:MAG: GtrA family protein [Acidiferrobacteraceae bacterium]
MHTVIRAPISRQVLHFSVVGGVGFLVDGGILTLLHSGFGRSLLLSRLCSFSVAVTVTWGLNRRYTFPEHRDPRAGAEWRRYAAVNGVGAFINLGFFFALVNHYPGLAARPLVPLALAALVALGFNFVGSKHLAFRGHHHGA